MKRTIRDTVIVGTAMLLLAFCVVQARSAECIVSDGDTLIVDGTKFRLDGIDAPELNQICLDEKGQPWKCGLDARDALAKLIANCAVRCEDKGPDKVHPDRRIGICTVKGMDITLNEWPVREGWAVNFEPYAKGRFLPDQADAAHNGRGIWKGCFTAPTNWRHWKKDAPLMGSRCPSDAASRIFDNAPCSIKGSRNHKFHIPGCRSYDRTTNVVKWFCSEDEARAEGYTKAGNCPRSLETAPQK
jgi:endonuclease YncB( thermonuclease family)